MKTFDEQWRPVEGYEELYAVSNFGRVKSLNYNHTGVEKIMKPVKDKDGYLAVNIYRNGQRKMLKVHRLVAIAFIPNQNNLPQVNHKDEDKTNNCASNLEFCNCKYNNIYGTRMEKVTSALSKAVEASKYPDFRTIELRFASTAEAERNGYFSSAVSTCCRGCYSANRRNFYKGLFWRYAV